MQENRQTVEPRQGLIGVWDKFVGPGASVWENLLIVLSALLGGAALVAYGLAQELPWRFWQYLVAALVMMDLVGGVVSNCSSVTKRWYIEQGGSRVKQFGFVAAHLHPFIIKWLFPGGDWTWATACYLFILAGALATLATPLYLKRPLASALICAAVLLGLWVLNPPMGFAWFLPLLAVKLILGHCVPERIYRPG